MESKHTKGEWNYCLNWDDKSIEIGTFELENIALVSRAYDEAEANAKLIAAAPEMFDELVKIMETYDKGTETYIRVTELLTKITE